MDKLRGGKLRQRKRKRDDRSHVRAMRERLVHEQCQHVFVHGTCNMWRGNRANRGRHGDKRYAVRGVPRGKLLPRRSHLQNRVQRLRMGPRCKLGDRVRREDDLLGGSVRDERRLRHSRSHLRVVYERELQYDDECRGVYVVGDVRGGHLCELLRYGHGRSRVHGLQRGHLHERDEPKRVQCACDMCCRDRANRCGYRDEQHAVRKLPGGDLLRGKHEREGLVRKRNMGPRRDVDDALLVVDDLPARRIRFDERKRHGEPSMHGVHERLVFDKRESGVLQHVDDMRPWDLCDRVRHEHDRSNMLGVFQRHLFILEQCFKLHRVVDVCGGHGADHRGHGVLGRGVHRLLHRHVLSRRHHCGRGVRERLLGSRCKPRDGVHRVEHVRGRADHDDERLGDARCALRHVKTHRSRRVQQYGSCGLGP